MRIGRKRALADREEGVAATEGWRRGEEGAVRRHSGARGVDRQQGGGRQRAVRGAERLRAVGRGSCW